MLETNGHGGNWVTAMEQFACSPKKLLDYSANINPLGPPASLQRLLTEEWDFIMHYPDPEVRELRRAISDKYGVMPESVLVGNGAAELIDLTVRTLKPRNVGVIDPAFSEYREAAEKFGAAVVSISTSAEDSFSISLKSLIQLVSTVDVLFLGQPNNPTGSCLTRETLQELIHHAENKGTKIILDEAFIDFRPDEADVTMLRTAASSPTVIVLRSMTKFYAIPALRLGYAISEPTVIQNMKRLQVPWSVNHLAQKAGVLALQDVEYEHRSRQLIKDERERLSAELLRVGCRTLDGLANFILVDLCSHHLDTHELQKRLADKCIMIRRCSGFIGLNDRYFRIAVRTPDENKLFISALEAALRHR